MNADIVILSAVRTPIGKFQGSLAALSAVQLGSLVAREAISKAGLESPFIDECIMGHVLTAGLGQNTARQVALGAGLPDTVSAMTVNKVCGSGLKAVALAAQALETGNAEVVLAGGMESMSNAPYLLPKARTGLRMGNATLIDSMIHDGLWDVYNDYHMGLTAENIAELHGISRPDQDQFALESHRRAAAAQQKNEFAEEIVAVPLPARKGTQPEILRHDESVRPDSTLTALSKLRPAFKETGTVTAGNSPGVSDGAAALVLCLASKAVQFNRKPIARVIAQATSGVSPAFMGLAPITGIRRLLDKAGWQKHDVDLYELNEAFSVQCLAVMRELELPPDRVNVFGGAVALGHPIGASGARVLTTLLHGLLRKGGKRGVAALCLGGGNSIALAVEVIG